MAPQRIGIRELREALSQAIRRVRRGETLEVTDRGRPVARIVPIDPSGAGLDHLVAQGKVFPPRATTRLPDPLDGDLLMTSQEALDILRGS